MFLFTVIDDLQQRLSKLQLLCVWNVVHIQTSSACSIGMLRKVLLIQRIGTLSAVTLFAQNPRRLHNRMSEQDVQTDVTANRWGLHTARKKPEMPVHLGQIHVNARSGHRATF